MKHLQPLLATLLLLAPGLTGCGDRRGSAGSVSPQAISNRVFQVRGVLKELPVDGRSAVIRHEEIPNYMPAMTMTLRVNEPAELRNLVPGDAVEFRLVVTDEDHHIESIRRIGTGTPVTNSTASASDPAVPPLRVGELMPEVSFLGEDGSPHSLSEFRGRALAFTFVFTRCPLPDFCPRMSKHFSKARALLTKTSGASGRHQFLSLSFDPAYDTPEILRTYARGYRGADAEAWMFGTLSADALKAIAPRLGLFAVEAGGSISHNLRTVVVDPSGRIHRLFDGNEWTPEDLADAMAVAVAAAPAKP